MNKNIINILGIVIALVGVGSYFLTQYRVNEYNTYVKKLRPLLKSQDALIQQISKSSDPQAAARVSGWIGQVKEQRNQFKSFELKKPAIQDMHAHWVKRTQHILDGLEALQQFFRTKQPQHLNAYKRNFKAAGQELKNFVKKRDAYFKKNKMKLKK